MILIIINWGVTEIRKDFMLMGQDPQLPSSNDSDNLYNRFMNKYPYALSNIVIAGILMFSFIMGFLFLEETHSRTKTKRDIGLEIGDFILNKLGYETPTRPWQRTKRSRIEPNLEQSQLTQDSSDTISSLSSDDDNSNPEIERLIVAPQPLYNSVDDNNEDVHENDRESIDDEDNKYVGPVPRRYSDALVRRYSSAQLDLFYLIQYQTLQLFQLMWNRNSLVIFSLHLWYWP